ncbi:MAG: hypothetical protein AAF491_09845 [Verrucomicrobiota bacterium]
MENDLNIINQFLADFPYEVLARTGAELDEDFKARLEQLARGNFPEDERDNISRDILNNPLALDYLADLARARQESSEN